MIKSVVLNKEYKTKKGYLIAAKRYENCLRKELLDRIICYKKGWEMYLGNPIYPQIRELQKEINNVINEKLSIL